MKYKLPLLNYVRKTLASGIKLCYSEFSWSLPSVVGHTSCLPCLYACKVAIPPIFQSLIFQSTRLLACCVGWLVGGSCIGRVNEPDNTNPYPIRLDALQSQTNLHDFFSIKSLGSNQKSSRQWT
jgi:hypothetical protein